MADLRRARKSLYGVLIVLGIIDVVAAFILIAPARSNTGSNLQFEFRRIRDQVQKKSRTVVPPDQVQQRIAEARTQIADFVQQRIPALGSAVPVELGKLANDSGVQLSAVQYAESDSDVPGVEQVKISATISGNYLQTVKFINSLERAKTFFVIDSVTLAEEQGGNLRLGLNLDAYLRGLP